MGKNTFKQKMRVTVQRRKVKRDPPVDIFTAVLKNKSGTWPETYGSKAEMKAFLRGVQASASLCGFSVHPPPVPKSYEKVSNY